MVFPFSASLRQNGWVLTSGHFEQGGSCSLWNLYLVLCSCCNPWLPRDDCSNLREHDDAVGWLDLLLKGPQILPSSTYALCCVLKRNAPPFRFLLRFLRIVFVIVVVWSTATFTYSKEQMTEALAQKERYACGARAAFVLIRMIGREVTYSTVLNRAPALEQGCSLEDLRNALQAHDVECAVLRLQLTDLSATCCPFILNTQELDSIPAHTSPTGDPPIGHFYLVTEVDKVGLHTYDPVTSQKRHWRWRSLADQWSGYAIVATQATIRYEQTLMYYLLGVNILVAAFVVASLLPKNFR